MNFIGKKQQRNFSEQWSFLVDLRKWKFVRLQRILLALQSKGKGIFKSSLNRSTVSLNISILPQAGNTRTGKPKSVSISKNKSMQIASTKWNSEINKWERERANAFLRNKWTSVRRNQKGCSESSHVNNESAPAVVGKTNRECWRLDSGRTARRIRCRGVHHNIS